MMEEDEEAPFFPLIPSRFRLLPLDAILGDPRSTVSPLDSPEERYQKMRSVASSFTFFHLLPLSSSCSPIASSSPSFLLPHFLLCFSLLSRSSPLPLSSPYLSSDFSSSFSLVPFSSLPTLSFCHFCFIFIFVFFLFLPFLFLSDPCRPSSLPFLPFPFFPSFSLSSFVSLLVVSACLSFCASFLFSSSLLLSLLPSPDILLVSVCLSRL